MNHRKDDIYPIDTEIKLEDAKFIDMEITESEGFVEVQFQETLDYEEN